MKKNSKHHDMKREQSERYQEFVKRLWLHTKHEELEFYETQEEQYTIGESVQGVEVKYDIRSHDTGNLYIEVAESRYKGTPLVPSGIYREDNTVTWLIGTYHYAYIIPKSLLIAYHKKQQPKEFVIPQGTSRGFLIARSMLDNWVKTGHIERIDVKLYLDHEKKESSYYVDYLENNYYITDITLLNNKNYNNMNNEKVFENKFVLAGKLQNISAVKEFASGFRKRTILLQDKVYAENSFQFELHKDRCELIDNFNIGDNIIVHFNVRCNPYNNNYYTNLVAWRIEKMDTEEAVAGSAAVSKKEFGQD